MPKPIKPAPSAEPPPTTPPSIIDLGESDDVRREEMVRFVAAERRRVSEPEDQLARRRAEGRFLADGFDPYISRYSRQDIIERSG